MSITRTICYVMIMAIIGVERSQCQKFSEDYFDGINHINMLPDAETAQLYMERASTIIKLVTKWAHYIRQLIMTTLEQICSVFGIGDSLVKTSVIRVAYKTWLAIQDELPQSYRDMAAQYSQVVDYFNSGFDPKSFGNIMDLMNH